MINKRTEGLVGESWGANSLGLDLNAVAPIDGWHHPGSHCLHLYHHPDDCWQSIACGLVVVGEAHAAATNERVSRVRP